MPKVNLDSDQLCRHEPIRKPNSPVSNRQATQRRAEDVRNRYRKLRKLKEQGREY